jgi:hypothetical protein
MTTKTRKFFIGLDLGQVFDFSTLAVVVSSLFTFGPF